MEDYFQKFIPLETMESAGFEHFGASDFSLLFHHGFLYVLNDKDYAVAKFKKNKLLRIFKTAKGQAPKEFILPRSLFIYDQETIAVYDRKKLSVMLFDLDLNYIRETKLGHNKFVSIFGIQTGIFAFLDYTNDDVFALLDKDFSITRTFIKANKTIPFERYYPNLLNNGFILDQTSCANTYRWYPRKICSVDIYDLNTLKLKLQLSWDQPFSPNQQDVSARRNMYFSGYVGKHGDFYVVQAVIIKNLHRNQIYYLLIFNEKGKLIFKAKFPYCLIVTQKTDDDSKLYFLDDEEDISYIDIKGIVK